jgi:hypothetical protein
MREKEAIGRVQQRRSREEMEQLADAFESGGLWRREFCQKHDVVVGTLDFYRRQKREMVVGHRLRARKENAIAEAGSDGRLVAVLYALT